MSCRIPVALVLLLLSLGTLGACASSRYAEPDAAGGDDGDGGATDDAAVDGPGVDAIDASTCARSPCDILGQAGCEARPARPVWALDFTMLTTGATKCRARNTTVAGDETTTCTMTTTCAPAHVCVGGRCRRYCDDDLDCPGAGGLCIIDLTQGTPPMPIPGAPATCSTDCVPTAATNVTCPATWACHVFLDDPTPATPASGDERYLSDCLAPPATGGGVGATCTGNQACAAGLDCVTLNPGGTVCRPTCACPGGNCAAGTCPASTGSCRGFNPPVVIGTATYGTCF